MIITRVFLEKDKKKSELNKLWIDSMVKRICGFCDEEIGYNEEFWYQEGEPFAYHKKCINSFVGEK